MFLFNMGCIGRHVTSLLSRHVTMTSETFYFKMADTIAAFINVNFMKIKHYRIKACKKKNHACKVRIDESVPGVTVCHHSASLVMPK